MLTASHAAPANLTPLSFALGLALFVAAVAALRPLSRAALVVLVAVVNGGRYVLTAHRRGLARLDAHDARELERIRAARAARPRAATGRRVTADEIAAAKRRHPAGSRRTASAAH